MIVINKIAAENVELPELLKRHPGNLRFPVPAPTCRRRTRSPIIDCIENAGGDPPS